MSKGPEAIKRFRAFLCVLRHSHNGAGSAAFIIVYENAGQNDTAIEDNTKYLCDQLPASSCGRYREKAKENGLQRPAVFFLRKQFQNTITMSNTISRETPLAEMTAGELADFLASTSTSKTTAIPEAQQAEDRRYVYGLKGIMELFNCSNVTAQRYKKGIIAGAVIQYGRKIVVDADKALELFKEAKA